MLFDQISVEFLKVTMIRTFSNLFSIFRQIRSRHFFAISHHVFLKLNCCHNNVNNCCLCGVMLHFVDGLLIKASLEEDFLFSVFSFERAHASLTADIVVGASPSSAFAADWGYRLQPKCPRGQ